MQTKFKARLIYTFNYELQQLRWNKIALLLNTKYIIIYNVINIKDNYSRC